jgi:glycine betaine/choline ABC-type transport system substrate-binding protein
MNAPRFTRRLALPLLSGGILGTSCLGGLNLTVGSKEGPEGMLLGEICALLLETKAKAKVRRSLALGPTSTLFQAIQNKDVHVYPEYARIGYRVFFKSEDPMDRGMSTEKLRGLFRTNSMSEWLDPLGFESNHILIVRSDDPNFEQKKTLSEVSADKAGWKLGFTSDFSQSPEGYSFLKTSYEIAERGAPRIEPLGQLYFGLKEKRIDILVTTSTDPLARDAKYKILEDDKGAFQGNTCSFLLHGPTADEKPEFTQTVKLLSGKIDNSTMLRLNGEVLVQKRGIAEVASEFLKSVNLLA